ncbi:hypothetical protein VMUT_0839 [Vulcanisaeta moutnovskia 768-28]|uniref:DUF5658 domain-containing protein n=1 Tax=Vulcanisaeta moutnovskia (strain 768-28) TaxID=985053 RepID=F0QWK1_VULM7|nr:hypothetical protein [Vulcanisaeta moutnovskia]ADY01049.1 hypothetical protein VMUT_0839 [Vulcanisaeta moutnovskia 768-28]
MNSGNQVELLLMATLANALDLATSYVAFSLLDLQELNYYATAMHLSNYLAAALAFMAYEIVVAVIYLVMHRFPVLRWFMAVFITMKLMAVVGNIAASMGFYGINNTLIAMNQLMINALKY